MPIHLTSASPKPVPHRRLVAPFNIMRSLSLCRKSRPTCTLSLAHVSACKSSQDGEAMQVDTLQLDLNTIHFVAVPPPPKSIRRTTKTNIKTKTTPNDINVIPFPTSAQTTTSPTQKRQQFQKKEQSERPVSSSISPPRKRARKDSLTTTTTSPQTSSRSSPSPRARALAQRVPPPRPSTPTPSDSDEMETQTVATDKHAVQPDLQAAQRHQKTSQGEQGQTELPPYSPSPPPYSPLVVASPTPIPLHIPIAVTPSSPPPSIPANSTTPSSSPPLPLPLPSSPSPPPPQRRQRIPSSELKFLIFLYRSLVSGLESRQQNRPHTQVRRARDGSRREQHLDGVLIEVDDDEEDDVDAAAHSPVAMDTTTHTTNGLTPSSLNEDLEVQDALLALRLRGFLKWNGVDEWMLRVDDSPPPSPPTSPPPPSTTTTNPFLDEGSPDSKMDVDVVQTVASSIPQPSPPSPPPPPPSPSPILSSRHLVTVLRMRGTCASSSGGRQGIGLGVKNRREKSKLGVCCYQAGDDNVMYDL